jgi:hypothetical protein
MSSQPVLEMEAINAAELNATDVTEMRWEELATRMAGQPEMHVVPTSYYGSTYGPTFETCCCVD